MKRPTAVVVAGEQLIVTHPAIETWPFKTLLDHDGESGGDQGLQTVEIPTDADQGPQVGLRC